MNTIKLRYDDSDSTTTISNAFIDTYMPRANGEFLKVYFLLARCLHDHSAVSISSLADVLHHTEQDVKRALLYWADEQILHLDYDEEKNISGIELLPLRRKENITMIKPTDESINQQNQTKHQAYPISSAPGKVSYTPKELAFRLEQSNLNQTAFIADTYLGKPLSINELNTLYYFHESLQMDAEFIEFLFEYCTEKGKKNMRYIEKVAISWFEDGIRSISEAKQKNSPTPKEPQVTKKKSSAKNKFNDFEQRSYDFDDIEQRLIAKVMGAEAK